MSSSAEQQIIETGERIITEINAGQDFEMSLLWFTAGLCFSSILWLSAWLIFNRSLQQQIRLNSDALGVFTDRYTAVLAEHREQLKQECKTCLDNSDTDLIVKSRD